ncbi:MAG: hypothetical protein AAFV62_14410 [Pseudomonadota bacterium]
MKRPHRTAHRWIWTVLALALPAMVLGALMLKQDPADLPDSERLTEEVR